MDCLISPCKNLNTFNGLLQLDCNFDHINLYHLKGNKSPWGFAVRVPLVRHFYYRVGGWGFGGDWFWGIKTFLKILRGHRNFLYYQKISSSFLPAIKNDRPPLSIPSLKELLRAWTHTCFNPIPQIQKYRCVYSRFLHHRLKPTSLTSFVCSCVGNSSIENKITFGWN